MIYFSCSYSGFQRSQGYPRENLLSAPGTRYSSAKLVSVEYLTSVYHSDRVLRILLAARLLNKQILIMAMNLAEGKRLGETVGFSLLLLLFPEIAVKGFFPVLFWISCMLRLRASCSFDLHIFERDSGLNIKV